jgi:ABC-type cobalamin/Fe3+-siderophores transport system ATPase subunit
MMDPLVAVQNVSFGYPGHRVLDSVSFAACGGEVIVLMGINGAGKSTLLDILAGLRAPDAGDVQLCGHSLMTWRATERSRRISHLPQGTKQGLPFTVEQVMAIIGGPYLVWLVRKRF